MAGQNDRVINEDAVTALKQLLARVAVLEAQGDILHNPAGLVPPAVTDDSTAGYSILSQWADISALPAVIYICRDATAGAAVWFQIAP